MLRVTLLGLCIVIFNSHRVHADWYLSFITSPSSEITSLSGSMSIPSLQKAGVYYIWPGIQPDDGSGVLQSVLDGRSGYWWMASGWDGSPTLPWGNGFNTQVGDTVEFSYTKHSANWTTTIQKTSTSTSTTNTFALAGKSFNEAVVQIKLQSEPWDFGPVTFANMVIEATGTDTHWCTNGPQSNTGFDFQIGGIKAKESNNVIMCNIDSLVLQSPNITSASASGSTLNSSAPATTQIASSSLPTETTILIEPTIVVQPLPAGKTTTSANASAATEARSTAMAFPSTRSGAGDTLLWNRWLACLCVLLAAV